MGGQGGSHSGGHWEVWVFCLCAAVHAARACVSYTTTVGAKPFSYEKVVQPILDRHCAGCHNPRDSKGIDLTDTLDMDRIPSFYKRLLRHGGVHFLDCGWNSGGNEKRQPLSFGVLKSRLGEVLNRGHWDVRLGRDELHAIKCWIEMNCPLWLDYLQRELRPDPPLPHLSRNK